MCSVKTPAPVEVEKPVFVRNPFLDDPDANDARSASALRRGRSSLVIPTGEGLGFSGRGTGSVAGAAGSPTAGGRSAVRSGGSSAAGSNRPPPSPVFGGEPPGGWPGGVPPEGGGGSGSRYD